MTCDVADALAALAVAHDALLEGRCPRGPLADAPAWADSARLLRSADPYAVACEEYLEGWKTYLKMVSVDEAAGEDLDRFARLVGILR